GKTVSWTIRDTGKGAGFFALVDIPSAYKNDIEAAHTTMISSLQPSLWNSDTWW
ncbi:uncharacterized protein BDR25DRAFT_153083, partial [Lindgomyces ingoldianus]